MPQSSTTDAQVSADEVKSKQDDAKINVIVLTLSGETVATLTLGLRDVQGQPVKLQKQRACNLKEEDINSAHARILFM